MALNDADLFLVNQGGVSKKITYENLKLNLNADEALWELDGDDIQPKDDTHNVKIGGGDIELNADGTGNLREIHLSKDSVNTIFTAGNVSTPESIRMWPTGSGYFGNGEIRLESDGIVNIGGTVPSPNIRLNVDGSATFEGSVIVDGNRPVIAAGDNLIIDEGTPQEVNVQERVLNLVSRLDALEANEIIDDAVDTSLLSLMASASARLAALEGGN